MSDEIKRTENMLNRAMRENAIAALMMVLIFMSLANGLVMGIVFSTISNQNEKVYDLQRAYEVTSSWNARLVAVLESRGIQVPETKEK